MTAAVLLLTACSQTSGGPTASSPSSTATASVGQTSRPPTIDADLARTLDQLPVPPGSVRLTAAALVGQMGMSSRNSAAKVSRTGYWRTTLDPQATLGWLTGHLSPAWSGGSDGTSGTTIEAEYGQAGTRSVEGPDLDVSIAAAGGGSSLVVTAYEIPLPVKSAAETMTGVTGAVVWTKDPVSPLTARPLRSVTASAERAARLAADVGSLSPDDGSERSCTAGADDVVLDFTTVAGPRRWLLDPNCGTVGLVPADGPALDPSTALESDVRTALVAARGPLRGTLFVTLTLAGHPWQSTSAPGAVTVSQRGHTVDRGTSSGGRLVILTEPAGAYEVTGVSGRLRCTPATVRVVADQQADVTLTCSPTTSSG